MKSAAAMILGESAKMDAFGLDTWGTPQAILEEVKKIMAQSPEDEYVLLCDIKGGSVCNALMELSMEPNVSVISGINLNIVLTLALSDEDTPLADEIGGMIEECRQGIQFFNASIMEEIKEKESNDEIW